MNRWKVAFFSFATVVFVFICAIAFLLSKGSVDESQFSGPEPDGEPIFFIETSKERLNYLIQSQLEKLKYNREQIDFTVDIDETVDVHGYVTVFSRKLNFRMHLLPVVQKDGNLLLRQDGFYIGELPIPSKQVLKFIRTSADLPKWVNIEPDKDSIYIDLNKIKVGEDLHVKVRTIDLKNNDISFEIYEPISEEKPTQ